MLPTGFVQISEEEKLKKRLQMTYEERFRLMMRLIRIQQVLKNAKIIHHDGREEKDK